MAKDVSGVICAMITPRQEDGSLSKEGLKSLVDHLVGSGVDVIFPTGSAGEGPLLSAEDKLEIISAVVEAVDGRAAVIPGITCTTTEETIRVGRACDGLGVEGVVVVTPWYYKVQDSTLLEYYRNLTGAIETPIIPYKIPQAAVNDISLDLLDSLSELDGIMAVKDSSGDMVWLSYAIALHGDRLKFFGGNDRLILPCLSAGASGHVSGSSNCFTEEVVDIWRHFSAGEIAAARKAQQLLLRKVLLLPAGKENSAIREVLRIQGMELGEPLAPMGILSSPEREKLRSGLASLQG
jgi:dihydrodipicolinate synthase/N-acetylneuraminate lyase